jgi:transcriptional regulator with XRE-family HTH domain
VSTNDALVTLILSDVKRFGTEIRRRRQSLDLSLAELAGRVGLTSNFIGTIENGLRNPSISTIASLAKGLEAPAAELIADAHGLGPSGLEVARLFNALTPVVQDRCIEFLRLICIRQDGAPSALATDPAAASPASASEPALKGGETPDPSPVNTPK